MNMPIFRRLSLAAFLFACLPFAAQASCQGAVMLARFHDAYRAVLVETGNVQINAATTVLVVVGTRNATAFSRQIAQSGESIDTKQLREALEDAATLAENFLASRQLPQNTFKHSQQVDWLGDVVNRTACRDSITAVGKAFRDPSEVQFTAKEKDKINRPSKQEELLVFLAWLLGTSGTVGAVGYGVNKFRNSHKYRKQVVERMPRRPISIELELIYTGPTGDMHQTNVSALDVSAGGMKLDWPDNNAPPGTIVTVALPDGQKLATVMWSNAYYVGVMFDTTLSRKQLEGLTGSHARET